MFIPVIYALGCLAGGVVVYFRRRRDPRLVRLYLVAVIGGIIMLVFGLAQIRKE